MDITIPEEITIKIICDKVDEALLDLLQRCGPEQNIDNRAHYSRNKTFDQLGLDPIQLLQLRSKLTQEFAFEIYPAFLQEYATPEAIIQFFIETKILTFKDWVYEIEWKSTPVPEIEELAINNLWIVFCEQDAEIATLLRAMLHDHRQQCIFVQPGKKFQQLGDEHFVVNPQSTDDFKGLFIKIPNISKLAGVVYLWGYEPKENCTERLKEFHKKTCGGLVALSNQLALLELPQAARLWVVTASMITDGNDESLADWPSTGLCKIVREEYPDLHCTYLAMDSKVSVVEACDACFRELSGKSKEPEIAYHSGERLVPRMVRGNIVEVKMPHFSADSSYLIAGGMRLLGIQLAKWYAARGAQHLVLLDERDVTPEIELEIDAIKKGGVEVSTFTVQFDDEAALRKAFNKIHKELPPLNGIVHAAGVVDNDLLLNMTWDRFEEIYRLKVLGSWNLHKLTESLTLDHFILFSSSLPDLAPLAKANHAVGNSFLDALAHYRRKRGMPAVAFDWGPRDLRHVEVRQIVEVSRTKSVESLKVEQAFQVLEQLFYFTKPQITVAIIKWAELLQGLAYENPLFDELAIDMGFKRVDVLGVYIKSPASARMEILQKYIHEQVRRVLNLHSSHNLELRRNFGKMGMSLAGMSTLRNRIQRDFHEAISLPINFVEAHSNIEELATALSRALKTVVEPVEKMPLSKIAVDLHEPIAIIGMSCRFPGNVTTPDNFWTMLKIGVDTITEDNGRFGGIVEDFKSADPSFFGGSSHYHSLELAWEALEYAGMPLEKIKETRTAVFIGVAGGYGEVARDISKYFELSGPAMAVEAGSASSLVSVDLACEKLRLGICDLAFAGGINVIVEDESAQPIDGKCRSLDAGASGSVISEGGGLLLLKRYSDALRDNDTILAVIKGVSAKRTGSIQAALKNAKIKPHDVQYIEVEGLGSIIDDSVEVNKLCSVYGEGRSHKNPLYLGSVKTNIGNTGAAAGIAGVIKCVMALQNEELPAQLHFRELNPLIEEGRNYVKVVTGPEGWPLVEESRYAAVNSFSLDGTDAHIILQQTPKKAHKAYAEKPSYLVTLSAKSEEELDELINRYKVFLNKSPATLAEIAYTSNTGRDHFDFRAAIVAKDHKELRTKIQKNDFLRGKKIEEKASLIKPASNWNEFIEKIAQEYVSGASIDWEVLYEGTSMPKVVLPTYCFKRGNMLQKRPEKQRKAVATFSDGEVAAEVLNDNSIIIKGDRRSESDLVKIKELKANRHITTVIVVYKE